MNLEGQTCIVTGASQGIGRATAQRLAALGARVLLVSRDPGRAEEARRTIVEATDNLDVECRTADLASLASVRELASRLADEPGSLHALVNNAGVASPDRRVTADGHERQFAINHLAPFLLTNLLLERLKADAPARIVNVSSWIHAQGTIDFEDLMGERGYTGPRAYNQSKLANVLFTYELARRLEGTGVTANCLHPGSAATGLNNFLRPRETGGALARLKRSLRATLHRARGGAGPPTPEQACRTSVHLAASPQVEGISGRYFVDAREAESSPASHDRELAQRLWRESERLVGLAS